MASDATVTMEKMYLVMRSRAPYQATVTHSSETEAKAEAERLSRKHNDKFFVFACVGSVEPMPLVRWEYPQSDV